MKKIASLAMSSILVFSLTSCGTQNTIEPVVQDTQVQALASKQVTLSMDKRDSKNEKKVSNSLKDATFKIGEKASSPQVKSVEEIVVKFLPPTNAKNDANSDKSSMIARYTLTSMNQTKDFEDGYKIGMAALEQMSRSNVYVARVSWSAGNATKSWQTGFRIVASALGHIAANKPNSSSEACSLVINMMDAAGSWEDGYRAGYAALKVISQTDNDTIKSITNLALIQSNSAKTFQSGFQVIKNALSELRRANI